MFCSMSFFSNFDSGVYSAMYFKYIWGKKERKGMEEEQAWVGSGSSC